jgi:hypothetical protein
MQVVVTPGSLNCPMNRDVPNRSIPISHPIVQFVRFSGWLAQAQWCTTVAVQERPGLLPSLSSALSAVIIHLLCASCSHLICVSAELRLCAFATGQYDTHRLPLPCEAFPRSLVLKQLSEFKRARHAEDVVPAVIFLPPSICFWALVLVTSAAFNLTTYLQRTSKRRCY